MLTIRAMSNGKGYAAQHLEHSDYYAEDRRVVGHWRGHGAEALGLHGDVVAEDFEAIRQGLHPETGEALRPRQSVDRLSHDGEVHSHARHLYDFTFSAPKSISVMATLGDDERLFGAHERAVDEALQELEGLAGARVRIGGANENRTTGNLVLAVYHHDTSRALDPQIHSHAVAGNLTYDGTEGRWKALQASDIYEQRAYLTEVYRNALAREVHILGYDTVDRRDSRGHDLGFELKGVGTEILERFSQRSAQRDQAIDDFVEERGRRPTENEIAVLVRASRADKLQEIEPEALRRQQAARLDDAEAHALEQLVEHARAHAPSQRVSHEPAGPSLAYAEAHVFERLTIVREHELLTEALRHGRGVIDNDEAKAVLRVEEAAGRLLRAGPDIATRESLTREREMIAAIDRGVGQFERLDGGYDFVPSDRLRPEQQQAVAAVLKSHDLAISLQGAAGAGKTATLAELHRALLDAGHDVQAVAPTRSAVEVLQKEGFSTATTVQALLREGAVQRHSSSDPVLIIDEAGMVSGRQMAAVLELAESRHARIVFSGDTKQLQSVEAVDALRILERESRLAQVSLTQVQRQTSPGYRAAIEAFRESPADGWSRLEQMGTIHEVAWTDRPHAVAKACREAQEVSQKPGESQSVLVVAATHEEVDRVTAAIRAHRLEAGELGTGARLEHDVPGSFTEAQTTDLRNFHAGQHLVFHRAMPGIRPGQTLEVERVESDHLVARTDTGQEHAFTPKQLRGVEVSERRPIEIAPHDRLLITANRRAPGLTLTNGELVTVSNIDDGQRIHLEDGRVLPATFKGFDYGYAITAHRSQGQTVDAVVISADTMRQELFYVAASRGREQVTVITSDKALLQTSIGVSSERPSATELVRRLHAHQEGWRHAMGQGMETAWALERGAGRSQEHGVDHGHRTQHAIIPAHSRGLTQEQGHARGQELGLGQ